MNSLIFHFKRFDWALTISALLLVVIGFISLYSSSLGRGNFLNFQKQLIFFIIALFLMVLFSFLDWRIFREDSYLILFFYFLSCVLLAGLFWLAPEIRGIRSWYKIGTLSIDPIEFTKIVLIILLAKYFSMRHIEMYRVGHIILSGFYVFIPGRLIFVQPDMGWVLILIALWIGILIISGIKIRHFLLLTLCLILVLVFGWSSILKDYQRDRILNFFVPHLEPLGSGWSQAQSRIAIGSGGIFGQGFAKGSQTQYGFLPEPQTDFIFAAIAEEFGLIGISVLLLLFSIILWRIIKIAIDSQSNFPRLFASGFSIVLISQIFIHIGMNIGILPIIGISLPFVSYGGSGLITCFVALGILQSIKID